MWGSLRLAPVILFEAHYIPTFAGPIRLSYSDAAQANKHEWNLWVLNSLTPCTNYWLGWYRFMERERNPQKYLGSSSDLHMLSWQPNFKTVMTIYYYKHVVVNKSIPVLQTQRSNTLQLSSIISPDSCPYAPKLELTEEKIHSGWKNIYSLEINSEASSSSKVHSLKLLLFLFNQYTSE